MPEGDTIHRAAAKLRAVLEQQRIVRCDCELASVDDWQIVGRTVSRVEARGKHLLIHCAPLLAVDEPDPRRTETLCATIWTHLGMMGRWQIQAASVPSPARAELALHTEAHVAICQRPEILKVLGPRGLLRNPMLAQLGPDLLDPGVDLDEAVQRLRALGPVELGDAIMRQTAVAGIGNVWKSELLFLEKLDPFASVDKIEPEVLRALLERASELMQRQVERGGPRRTRSDRQAPRERLWVYELSGRPCHVCGTIIAMRRQGALARSTYYCPSCQSARTITNPRAPSTKIR